MKKAMAILNFSFDSEEGPLENTGPPKLKKSNLFPLALMCVEMGSYSKQFAKSGSQELSLEERNILAVAFKNVVGTRRAAWRVLSSIQKKENIKGNAENVQKVKNYKQQIETELTDICQNILDLLEETLVPNSQSDEAKVFFFKMKADFLRYIAEFSTADQRNTIAQKALKGYEEAQGYA